MDFDSIPDELKKKRRWTLYRLEPAKNGGKKQKVPYQPNGQHASSTNPNTWTDFESVASIPDGFDGISFALCADDGLVCVDIDDCRTPENGDIVAWAEAIVEELNSYTEISPSGTGLHIFVRGTIPKNSHRQGSRVEIYSDKKIMAMGQWQLSLGSAAIEARDLASLFARAEAGEFAPQQPAKASIPLANDSAEDFRLIGEVQRNANANDADALEAAFQKALPERYTDRNKEKGPRGGKNWIRYSIENFLRLHPSKPTWRQRFHRVDELPDGDIAFLIEGILPEGVSFVGALSGAGKTWFCLSMARALSTGKKFLGNWKVPEPVDVLYLCPEMSAKTFKKRCKRFGIQERFHCQTISDGAPLNLSDLLLKEAIRELKPVVFLDTAIRFAGVEDENSASQNALGLAKATFGLIHLGAKAVVPLHHRAKDTAKPRVGEMTLENVLRGTGDLGAMCDTVWGLQFDSGPNGTGQYVKESRNLMRLLVRCVKARDFRTPDDFRIQLEPFIDQIGDFAVLTDESPNMREAEIERLDRALSEDPTLEKTKLEELTGIGRNRQEDLAAERGWTFNKKSKWTRRLL